VSRKLQDLNEDSVKHILEEKVNAILVTWMCKIIPIKILTRGFSKTGQNLSQVHLEV
jgi:hypothetical protein